MAIGDILKAERAKKQLTQEEVAAAIFVSQKTISNWEAQRTLPDIENIIRLARLYDVTLDALLLEGSDIVEDIKVREKIAALNHIYLLGPVLTAVFLLGLMYLPREWADRQLVLIALAFVSNYVTVYYFKNNLSQLKGTSEKLKNESRRSKWLMVALVLLIGFFSLYLWRL